MSRNRYDWSKLCPDLLRSILEGLHYNDYHRARTVCSNWYSVSTTCKRPLYPWRILFKDSSTSLFDPGEDKTHEIQHPGVDFSECSVLASCSNWLLIVDFPLNLFLLNVFTQERIDLPSMESSILGDSARSRSKDEWESFIKRTDIVSSRKTGALWVNERTGDYAVAWSCKQHYLFSYKKGDGSWFSLEGIQCQDLVVCKRNKLYVLTLGYYIKIFDLSGDSLKEVIEGNPYCNPLLPGEFIWRRKLAVTNSGEVLIIVSLGTGLLLRVYKMDLRRNWVRVDSIGGEMLIFGHGVTIRAPVKEISEVGIKSDSICFLDVDLSPFQPREGIKCGVFDLAKSTITWPKPLDDSVSKSFWFVPGYA